VKESYTFNVGKVYSGSPLITNNNENGVKYVITYLHFVRVREDVGPRLNVTFVKNGRSANLLPINFSLSGDYYVLDILGEGQSLVLLKGDFLIATSDNNDAIEFVVSGERYEDI
jgi:hypothetical protein